MTTTEDAKLVAEIRQLLERLVVPRLDEIKKQLEESTKRAQRFKQERKHLQLNSTAL